MPPITDVRAHVLRLRKRLKIEREGQEFISLEAFHELTAKPAPRKKGEPKPDPRLWLDGVSRILAGLYVHLSFKRTRYGANPVEALQALERNLPMPAADFNQAMLAIFRELHDPHTTYRLPEPYRSSVAFLPFLTGAGYDFQPSPGWLNPRPRFLVTHVARHLAAELKALGFEPGARITHWNGMPIKMVVHQLALRENGANRHACFARAMDTLTIRSLSQLIPPDAPTATIRFEPPAGSQAPAKSELVFDWSVRRTQDRDDLRRLLFDLPSPEVQGWLAWDLLPIEKVAYQVLFLPHPTAAHPVPVGIIRIRSFTEETDSFVNQFAELVEELRRRAPLALILDVRGNRGGNIPSGERLLQMFTPGPVTPASFQFLNTPLLHHLVRQNPEEAERLGTFGLETNTGSIYSRPARLTTEEDANHLGHRYYGRVALITDALCYSATDIFAAGFQDHRIGPVIGVDGSTGGGGANVWSYDSHVQGKTTEDGWTFPQLPDGTNLQFSVRQSLRAGRFQGDVLEDFGVTPDFRYFMTEDDLFKGDQRLYDFAFSKLLWGRGLHEVSVDLHVATSGEGIQIHCQTRGVSRCEVVVGKQVMFVFNAHSEGCRWDGFVPGVKPLDVELRCHDWLPRGEFPFFAPLEADGPKDGAQLEWPLLASRKVLAAEYQRAAVPPALPAKTAIAAVKKILYFVQGSRARALEGLAISEELIKLCPDVEIQFASYGPGAKTLQALRQNDQVIDLELPDRPSLFAVRENFPKIWQHLPGYTPQLIVAHEEFEVAELAGILPCPCVLITANLDQHRWHQRERLLNDLWLTIFLAPNLPDRGDRELSDFPISATGPILRPLPLWRPELCDYQRAFHFGMMTVQKPRQEARREARRSVNLPENELIVAVFIHPGDRTELAAPLYQRLKDAFDHLDETKLARRTWSDDLTAIHQPFQGKRLLWDQAAQTHAGRSYPSDGYGAMMAAADLAITKCDRGINFELAFMGLPAIEVAYPGFDDAAGLNLGNKRVRYPGLEVEQLMRLMESVLDPTLDHFVEPDQLGEAPFMGLQLTAARLNEVLLAIHDTCRAETLKKAQQLFAKQLDFAAFQKWFEKYSSWFPQNSDFIFAVQSALNNFPPFAWKASPGETEEAARRALETALAPYSAA